MLLALGLLGCGDGQLMAGVDPVADPVGALSPCPEELRDDRHVHEYNLAGYIGLSAKNAVEVPIASMHSNGEVLFTSSSGKPSVDLSLGDFEVIGTEKPIEDLASKRLAIGSETYERLMAFQEATGEVSSVVVAWNKSGSPGTRGGVEYHVSEVWAVLGDESVVLMHKCSAGYAREIAELGMALRASGRQMSDAQMVRSWMSSEPGSLATEELEASASGPPPPSWTELAVEQRQVPAGEDLVHLAATGEFGFSMELYESLESFGFGIEQPPESWATSDLPLVLCVQTSVGIAGECESLKRRPAPDAPVEAGLPSWGLMGLRPIGETVRLVVMLDPYVWEGPYLLWPGRRIVLGELDAEQLPGAYRLDGADRAESEKRSNRTRIRLTGEPVEGSAGFELVEPQG